METNAVEATTEGEEVMPTLTDAFRKRLNGSSNDVRQMSIGAIALLRHDESKLYQQAKHLVKTNRPLARAIFTTNIGGWTPLHACAQKGSKKLVKVMLSAGLDVNFPMGKPEGLPGKCTLLHIAANSGHVKIMDYLIGRGADVNATDSYGRTPLFYANRASKREAVKLLLEKNAEILEPHVRTKSRLPSECTTPEPRLTNFCFLIHKP
ncbi:phytochrome-interacting ankyrin-repeat protein 2-like isoform X1 [Haliotis rufescens]|uniref:phytochrome-interacting ankyrin-repeat protein 2-like isoform X1 n=1 Tax=Haliotis rufescens TaxID=6454 RepID=UPI001EB0A73C|nr:phytochrome-interacting ankyrin-repeat protein 2-like isoform X1 [Haliotis rufescens]